MTYSSHQTDMAFRAKELTVFLGPTLRDLQMTDSQHDVETIPYGEGTFRQACIPYNNKHNTPLSLENDYFAANALLLDACTLFFTVNF